MKVRLQPIPARWGFLFAGSCACSAGGTLTSPAPAAAGLSPDPPRFFFPGPPPTVPRKVAGPTGSPTQPYSHGNPTVAEQYMLELVNRARANPDAEAARFGIDLNEGLAPGTISATPKPPLAMNGHLLDSARGHSTWMLAADLFQHAGADGSSPGDRMSAAGYVFSGTWSWGENIAWRGSTGPVDLNSTVALMHEDLFVDAGIADRGHRLNLMDEKVEPRLESAKSG